MRSALLTFSALVLLGVAAPAWGWDIPPTTQAALRDASLPIAESAWPGSPCAGRETVVVDADRAIDDYDRRDGVESDGRAILDSCTVLLRHQAGPFWFCTAVVHEFGHLAGYVHAEDEGAHPSDPELAAVMAHNGTVYSGCLKRFPQPASSDVAGLGTYALWAKLPGASEGRWAIHCEARPHSRRGTCRAVDQTGVARRRIYRFRARVDDVVLAGPIYRSAPTRR